MSSEDDAKKRKRSDQYGGLGCDTSSLLLDVNVQGNDDNAVTSAEKIMADMKAMFDQKLSQIEQKMKREMDDMKDRISHVEELENKCQDLEDRCSSLESSVKILKKHWQYSAPDIPRNHWFEQGWDEDYADAMDNLLTSMKDVVSELQAGNFCISLGEEDGPLLLYDRALLPYWNAVIDALNLYRGSLDGSIGAFSISNVALPPGILGPLSQAVKNIPFPELALHENDFADSHEGTEFAIRLLQSNSSALTEFTWIGNLITDMEDASRLVEAINDKPSIELVHLPNSCGEDVNGYSLLCTLLAGENAFKSIYFGSNYMVTMGNTHIPDFLAKNPPLRQLILDRNSICDNDAYLIAIALRQNNNLRQLSLYNNDVTQVGRSHLSNAIFDSESFNSIFKSNHICNVIGVGVDESINNSIMGTDMGEINRRAKVNYLLSSRNREGTNANHLDLEFGNDRLKLAPNVLGRLQPFLLPRHQVSTLPLSILYEIIRSWNMPSLYSYKNNGAVNL